MIHFMITNSICPSCGKGKLAIHSICSKCKDANKKKLCSACDEIRPLHRGICKRCRDLKKKKPILPLEETFEFTLGYASKKKAMYTLNDL